MGAAGFDLNDDLDARLARHQTRALPFRFVAARARLLLSFAGGALAGFLLPDSLATISRALIGWNAAVACYLALGVLAARNSNSRRIRYDAQRLDDGRFFVLAFSALAAAAAVGAIVAELAVAKDLHGADKALHLSLAMGTIVSSWLYIHMSFALHYAHEFYLRRRPDDDTDEEPEDDDDDDAGDADGEDDSDQNEDQSVRRGLIFPRTSDPTYLDFVYFSYTIGVASQTADVEISSRAMRAVALAHSVLSFFFNTTILALTINLAAGLF